MTLAWTKAAAVRGIKFTRDEDAAGWPATFQIHRLAILQGAVDDLKLQRVLHRALFKDCESGALEAARLVIPVPATVRAQYQHNRFGSEEWRSREFLGGTLTERAYSPGRISLSPPVDRVDYQVAPAAFLRWLIANKQTPSEHIDAWFEARGIVAAAAGQDAPAQALAINGKVWTPEKLRGLLAHHDQLKGRAEKAPTKTLAERYGVGETTIKTRLREARELVDQPSGKRKKSATPFPTMVHRLK
jgi:hypothetical protein